MSDINIRKQGRAGRITLTRPQALNALTYEMCLAIDAALLDWQTDPDVALVLIDAEGPRAFCSGGDIAEMYATGRRGDWHYGRRFWRDEYRMNARIKTYAKPIVSFLQGFTMGGGVGLGCHAKLRVVGESAQIAMPECGIGLVPDVGGSLLLARAPGALGACLGLTGTRMGPGDALWAGFADVFIPEADWDHAKAAMIATGHAELTPHVPPQGKLMALRDEIDHHFSGPTLGAIAQSLSASQTPFAQEMLKALQRGAPLAMAACLEILRRLGSAATIQQALALEYRFTYRAMEHGDFLEGIRAALIDRDRSPRWRHAELSAVSEDDIAAMLAPLGAEDLTF